jgi:hypothetical protein
MGGAGARWTGFFGFFNSLRLAHNRNMRRMFGHARIGFAGNWRARG